MIDASDVLRDYLLTKSAITTLADTRIWAEMTYPPTGYKPSQGGAIVFKARPARGLDSSSAILHSSWQFKFYGLTIYVARNLYLATTNVLFDAGPQGASFESGLEVAGQSIPEPATDWFVILAFYETWMQSELPLFVPS